ncbi:MAG: murein biosynthesis integral membrane protein MurJ [Phycisphaeraceae bacterium]|nr:murein biosynthesis integral membrane protein MurJ [Phycisphaerales bacterium]MCB9861092.1 murein biosynthesis integral membrane protein MurJ [Phycisphaeraceae bacterium]
MEPEPQPEADTHQQSSAPRKQTSVSRSLGVVSGLTLISRICGLARDVLLARVFGDTAVASAFAAALSVPNIFRRLFGEGALSAAIVPEYAGLAEKDAHRASAFAWSIVGLLVMATGVLWLIFETALALGLVLFDHSAERAIGIRLLLMTMPFMPLICVAATTAGMLQVHGRFAPQAAQPIIMNCMMILALAIGRAVLGLNESGTAMWVAGAITLSGAVQVVWHFIELRKYAPRRWALADANKNVRAALKRFVPAVIGLGVTQLNSLADVIIATWPIYVGATIFGFAYPLDESSNSVLFYAQRFYMLPLGLFGTALGTVLFPVLARSAENREVFIAALRNGMMGSLFLALPACAGIVLVARDMTTALAYGSSQFSADGATRCAGILAMYSTGIWAFALQQVVIRSFYSLKDTVTPVRIAAYAVLLNFGLNVTLMWFMHEQGLAFATVIASIVQLLILCVLLHRRMDGKLFESHDIGRVHTMLFPLLGLIACVLLVQQLIPGSGSLSVILLRLFAATIAGGAAYLGLCIATRNPGMLWLIGKRS